MLVRTFWTDDNRPSAELTRSTAPGAGAPQCGSSRRQIIMVVNLDTPAEMAELMYALTWFTCSEPTFTPVMGPEIYAEAIANAKRILSPPT